MQTAYFALCHRFLPYSHTNCCNFLSFLDWSIWSLKQSRKVFIVLLIVWNHLFISRFFRTFYSKLFFLIQNTINSILIESLQWWPSSSSTTISISIGYDRLAMIIWFFRMLKKQYLTLVSNENFQTKSLIDSNLNHKSDHLFRIYDPIISSVQHNQQW